MPAPVRSGCTCVHTYVCLPPKVSRYEISYLLLVPLRTANNSSTEYMAVTATSHIIPYYVLMDKLRTCVCVSTYVQMCMYICVSVKIKKGFDIQYLLSIIGASLSSPTLTMSTAPLSVCVCAVRTYVRHAV